MQKPDMRIDAGDDFTVELQNETENAVSCRMLWPKVDGEIAEFLALLVHGQTFGPAFSSPGSG